MTVDVDKRYCPTSILALGKNTDTSITNHTYAPFYIAEDTECNVSRSTAFEQVADPIEFFDSPTQHPEIPCLLALNATAREQWEF
jgi:hypothetical protein